MLPLHQIDNIVKQQKKKYNRPEGRLFQRSATFLTLVTGIGKYPG